MDKLTPMMAQYKQIKAKYPDSIVMYRLGDFYEMFFEDALLASKLLQITLTARNKGSQEKAPMCGVPYHAVDNYIAKLTRAGKKVAICDQITEPNGKGIVEREVTRVITPGTTFDENIIDKKANNFVSAVAFSKEKFAFAYSDITTGEFKVTEVNTFKELRGEISRINPAECLIDEKILTAKNFDFANTYFFKTDYAKDAEAEIRKHFSLNSLKIFGLEGKTVAIFAAGILLDYLLYTQKSDLSHVRKINYYETTEFMSMDESCIRNLELFGTTRGGQKDGSLINVLDQTVTNMGGRRLRNIMLRPLIKKEEIEERLKKVDIFFGDQSRTRDLRDKLKEIFDIERLLSRLSLGSGNARDMKAMQKSLEVIPEIKKLIQDVPEFGAYNEALNPLPNLTALIEKVIVDEAPISIHDGGIIREGFNAELDDLRGISTEGKTFIKNLQEKEIARTGINSLKIRFNTVFGYYIEISKANLNLVPADYIRKQTLVNAERFITPELKEYEDKVLNAEERIKNLEYEIFYATRIEVLKEIVAIQKNAETIALLDIFANFAFIAIGNNYCRPQICEEKILHISEGRHPVIEKLGLKNDFVPNDTEMNEHKDLILITGPNMGGKSTYLRQNALIVLMAQMGCYVPAKSAEIGIADRIFTRVGASDNLTKGESTFMVEMQEASYILNNATEKSLIILDELGRGTSTYDGVSIAWAVVEFLHDNIKARTLFATHYHELIELADKLERAFNLSAKVTENEKEGVIFLYKIVEGGVDKSYGIEVAKLAGLPLEIISRARGVLQELEEKHIKQKRTNKDQLDMFDQKQREQGDLKKRILLNELKGMDLNNMTPLQAMQKLEEIRRKSMENI